jgi:DNA-directed RNA polymerase subunit RPC12/RpoP
MNMKFDDPTCPRCGGELNVSYHFVVDDCGAQVEFDPPQTGSFDEYGTITCPHCRAILRPVMCAPKMVILEADEDMVPEDSWAMGDDDNYADSNVSEEEMSEPLNTTEPRRDTPCDGPGGGCPYDAVYSRDCEYHCGLGR